MIKTRGGTSGTSKKDRGCQESKFSSLLGYKARDVNPSVEENAGKSTRKDQGSDDDDVVVVSSTASKRRTRASTIALEKKRAALDVGGEVEAEEVMDLEELDNLIQKKKATKKSKGKAKMTSIDDLKEGAVSKKRKGVFISKPSKVINRRCGRQTKGITGSTLKLANIIKILTGNALYVWPTKGQLPASFPSLRYAVMHKMAIANLVPTSNNTNVSEAIGRMMYVTRSGQELDFGRVIFDQIVDHSKIEAKLKPIDFSSLICSILIHQHPDILKVGDGSGEDSKPLTSGKRVVDVEIKGDDKPVAVLEGEAVALLIKAYKEEQSMLEADILVKKNRVAGQNPTLEGSCPIG
ncbi:hypothetical protein LIER_02856 [Lithospermum erythrorhizon]|uniref:Envelope-like protein n=1 Tax=Lithospermum erythrorhizon TaxID=34254 RepID=A0AAV3NUV5_LITER